MGSTQAEGLAAAIDEGLASLEMALTFHLTSNHYPPVPTAMVPVCIAAIEAYERYDNDYQIDLPEGITWRGNTQAPAWAVMDDLHLHAFVRMDEDEYDDTPPAEMEPAPWEEDAYESDL